MNHNPARLRIARGRRRSFTMVELLVTVTILGILASLMLGALVVTRASARQAGTRATIAKLHNIITAKYESYRTRRVPLSDEDVYRIAAASGYTGTSPAPANWAGPIRLRALRDIMRMEMPERWSDITNNPQYVFRWNTSTNQLVANPPSIYLAYRSRYASVNPSSAHAPAKCLYMIVMMAGGEDARRQFRSNEIATDTDGYSMFIDGWGNPIYFLRWAPGFVDSDIQWNCWTSEQVMSGVTWDAPAVLSERQAASQQDHDPLDTRRIDFVQTPTVATPPQGWRLVPLIYSAGPDGEYGIGTDNTSGAYVWAQDHYLQGFGRPVASGSGAWAHFDNIHNHRVDMEAK